MKQIENHFMTPPYMMLLSVYYGSSIKNIIKPSKITQIDNENGSVKLIIEGNWANDNEEYNDFKDVLKQTIFYKIISGENKLIMKKSNMKGIINDYQKMYDTISKWNTTGEGSDIGPLHSVGYSISDAPYFGWTGEQLENEMYHYNEIETAYNNLMVALENALGINNNNN